MSKPRIEVRRTPIKFRPVQSKRFLCAKCLAFCVEFIPVLEKYMGQQFYAQLKKDRDVARKYRRSRPTTLKPKMTCPNGHHKVMGWTFYDITSPVHKRFGIRHDNAR